VVNQENRIVQNHFASVADVKPGLFRWLLLKSVLKLIHLVAAISANQGSLSGITSWSARLRNTSPSGIPVPQIGAIAAQPISGIALAERL
jgi:hypothetical protein